MTYYRKLLLTVLTYSFLGFVICFSVSIYPVNAASNSNNANSDFVSIDFNNVDIRVFIKFMSNLTGKNFIVDSRVKGKVTVISPKKLSVADAYKVFESVLDLHGFATVQSGKIIKIGLSQNAKTDNVSTRLATTSESARNQIVTRIIPLEYANSQELKTIFAPLVPKGSVILSYRKTITSYA